ncbi:hypothetical protein BDY24DRAFT_430398, partial [Mrakia frigida]|uniref:uncharacterized protein n=1 Tax=Mrakia frigida TaxID=29902 RepID=UPI003FCBEEF1
SLQLYNALSHIFAKYCTPPSLPESKRSTPQGSLFPPPPSTSYLSDAGLDAFACDTNGSAFDADTKGEIKEFFDLDEESGGLTLKGFEQMYQLQTEADEEETWKDLAAHGFDRSLRLVSSRREDEIEEAAPVAFVFVSSRTFPPMLELTCSTFHLSISG